MPTVHRATLPEQIATHILHQLISDGRRVGDALPPEARLAESFDVSRPAVREALKWLAGQGYVEIVNGRGTLLREADGSQLGAYFNQAIHIARVPLAEMMESRRPLEIESAVLAARRRTPAQLAALHDVIARMRGELTRNHSDVYVDLDLELHVRIAEASRNTVIHHLIRSLRSAMNDSVHDSLYRRRTRQQLERVHEMHEAIVDEIRLGNAEAAGHAMRVHFDEALSFLYRDAGARRAGG